jgi:hypothetical protein
VPRSGGTFRRDAAAHTLRRDGRSGIIVAVSGTLAAEWGTGQVAWSLFWFAVIGLWLYLAVRIIADVLRSDDLGGVAKVAWILAVVVVPFLGVFAYVVAQGDGMTARSVSWDYADRTRMRPFD